MSFTKGTFFYFMLWLCCMNCDCQCHGITTREAKSFYQTRPSNPYLMTNDFTPLYVKRDRFKDGSGADERKLASRKETELDNNQISWISGGAPATSTEGPHGRDYWLTEFGETDKIITVRVSSSVAVAPSYADKPKLAALQRAGFDVEVPAGPSTRYGGYAESSTSPRAGNDSEEGRYYETRIEAVSSRREVVFGGKSRHAVASAAAPREYYPGAGGEFCEMPETNYEAPEKDYEEPERNYEVDEVASLMSDGRAHGEVVTGGKGKLSYVMEGRDFRKYRVEERTPDGFIVGEYGFIRNEDGKLHGVRYTADVNANPRLIYDALVKFLSL